MAKKIPKRPRTDDLLVSHPNKPYSYPTSSGLDILGNAVTATRLQTAREINGVAFDGTTNITVTAAAGTLTGTTLASNVVSSSLTSVGTLITLTVDAGAAGGGVAISGNAATLRQVQFNTAGVARWLVRVTNTAESGSNVGSDFQLLARADDGSLIDAAIAIVRAANGSISFGSGRTVIATTFSGALSGNASTATSAATLTTARNINGVSFNGSANITVTADASTLTGATLASGVTASSLTSVGTLTGLTVGSSAVAGSGTITIKGDSAGGSGLTQLIFQNKDGVNRWIYRCDITESGSDSGSDWGVLARKDDGSILDRPLQITRAAGGVIQVGPSSGTRRPVAVGGELRVDDDIGGASGHNTLTGVSDLTTNSTGVGTIKFKGTTSRDSTGFIKFYVGTTAYYVPVFSAITG